MAEENHSTFVLKTFFKRIQEAKTSLSLAKDSLSEAKDLNLDWAFMYKKEFDKAYNAVETAYKASVKMLNYVNIDKDEKNLL